MLVSEVSNQLKCRREFRGQSMAVVTADFQPTAFCRSIQRKCSDDQMSTDRHGPLRQLNVFSAIGDGRQKMKNRPVMPDIELTYAVRGRDVGDDPLNSCGLLT